MPLYPVACDACHESNLMGAKACQQCGNQLLTQLERTRLALEVYSRSPAPHSPKAAAEALEMLKVLPSFVPAPKAAQSDIGLVTLFWNFPHRYADIEFPGDVTFSVFTREHRGETRLDAVLERQLLDLAPSALSHVMYHLLSSPL